MKKTNPIWLMALILALAVVLVACGTDAPKETTSPTSTPKETTSVSRYESVDTYQDLPNHLSWEQVNKFPIVNENMTIEEARNLCIDFFRYAKTALWIPDNSLEFIKNGSGSQDEMSEGVIYGGLPYVGLGSGNIYRLMDYMDPDTGVVDIKNAVNEEEPYDGWKTFGNQCSIGAYWGWGRVINSAAYKWTQNCLVINKMPRVGPYTYDDDLKSLSAKTDGTNTVKILQENGTEVMYKSYAEIIAGDGLVYYTTAGHVIMASSDAHVEYKADGSIDPDNSFITIIDQGQTWIEDGVAEDGTQFTYKGGVDTKKTFRQLYTGNYMPFTYLEFLGLDPFESSKTTFSYTGKEITTTQLFNSEVKSNYGISDVYAIVYDEDGNEIYKHAVRATQASQETVKLVRTTSEKSKVPYVETWGNLGFAPGKTYTVKILVQLSTGERPEIYTGTLVQG